MNEAILGKIVPMKGGECPMCGNLQTQENRPFCSNRCASLDLSKWLNEVYRVPTEEIEESDDNTFFDD